MCKTFESKHPTSKRCGRGNASIWKRGSVNREGGVFHFKLEKSSHAQMKP